MGVWNHTFFRLHSSFHYRSSLLLRATRTVISMGILLHILLALIVSDAFGRKHLGRWALILGAGCSLLLDIPSFFYDSVDIFDQLHSHNWSHSLFGVILYMLILSGIAFAQKKSPLLYLRVAGPVFCTHLYFDISTTNGIMLLFPISSSPIQFHGFARFDPIIIIPLLATLFLTYKIPRDTLSQKTLFFLLSYSIFAHGITLQAKKTIAPIIEQMGFSSQNIHVSTPTFVFPIRRITVKDNNRVAVSYVSPFTTRPPRVYVRESISNRQVSSLINSALGQRFLQVSSSMIFTERRDNQYLFSDIRFGGFVDPWDSSLRLRSLLDKGSASPLEHVYVYSKTPILEDIQQGWMLLSP